MAPSIENPWQDAENVRQQRSRIVKSLNVPQGYASGLHSLRPCWTAILSIPLEAFVVPWLRTIEALASPQSYSVACQDTE